MNPESIVVSLDMAKRLAKAGWPQDEGTFHWSHSFNVWQTAQKRRGRRPSVASFFAAPTASELWERMPIGTELNKKKHSNKISIPCIVPHARGTKSHAIELKREQDAIAAMYIYLAEHNLL